MTSIIACVNLKGGVGKTALAVNFAAYCGSRGFKTLLIDLDPQTNATFSCMDVDAWEEHAQKHGTVADLFGRRRHTSAEGAQRDVADIICSTPFENVDLIPSHLDLFTIDLDLAAATMRETKLRRALEPIKDNYKIIVCDCPPNLTIPTQNALAMSTHFVVPVSPDFLSALGIGILLSRIGELCADLENADLKHAGIVISRVGRPALSRAMTVAALRQQFGSHVLKSEIRERVVVMQATEQHKSVYDMGDKDAIAEFSGVSLEILKRMGVTK